MLSLRLYRTIMLVALAVVTIYYTQMVTMPIIFSGLCALLVHPLVKKLESIGFNLPIASLTVVIGVALVLLAVFGVLAYQGMQIMENLPTKDIKPMLDDPIQALDKKTNLGIDQYPEQVRALTAKVKSSTAQFTMDALLMANNTMTFLLSCPVFIFFMLISRSQIRKCYYNSFKPEKRAIANRILQQIEMVYISYIRGLFYVMFIVSVLTAIGLYALGIDYAIFLGILAGILTLIPYVGVFISALIPAVIALLTKDSMWYVVGVIGIFALVQFLEGNFFTPKIMGDQVGLNPLVVIISIIIFGAIGGIVGMILTIPILAFLKTIAFYIRSWRPFRYLLQANK